MNKCLNLMTGLFLCLGLAMCSSSSDVGPGGGGNGGGENGNGSGNGNPVDPLKDFYGSYLSSCMQGMQIHAVPAEDGKISLAALAWARQDCTATYALLDIESDPAIAIEAPIATQKFTYLEVEGIPQHFFVLALEKINPDENDTKEYSIFYQDDAVLAVLNSYQTSHTTWAQWLTEDNVPEFTANPTTYTFEDKVLLLNRITELPKPMAVIYGKWLSGCSNVFDTGKKEQIFADISAEAFKGAILKWSGANCTGSYVLHDLEDGVTVIDAPNQSQTLTMSHITGVPSEFYLLKMKNVADASIRHIVWGMDISETDSFCQLFPPFTGASYDGYNTWASWSDAGGGAVGDFAASDPRSSYVPSGGRKLICSNKVTALP